VPRKRTRGDHGGGKSVFGCVVGTVTKRRKSDKLLLMTIMMVLLLVGRAAGGVESADISNRAIGTLKMVDSSRQIH